MNCGNARSHACAGALLLAIGLLCAAPAHGQDGTATITVEIAGFAHDEGQAGIVLFAGPSGFPQRSAAGIEKTFAAIRHKTAVVSFHNIPCGQYAVSVFHDANRNGKLDTNSIGIPREGFGASNNAKSRFGPPRYKDARFEVHTSTHHLSITMQYHQ